MSFGPNSAFAVTLLAAYLAGSIPFGLLLTQMAGLGDIRRIGSGNIGATNVLRTGKRGLAAATLVLDLSKGAVAVLLAGPYAAPAACAVVLGHIFPPWLHFRGGKGVATAGGALIALSPAVGSISLGVWLLTALTTRYSSIAALAACITVVVTALLLVDPHRALAAILIALLVAVRHHANIRRFIAGEESRINLGRSRG